ncbi:HHL148Wp [Eremothecium sinecaudum]|uniref:non-specific serine/threonine protein kinase n=1 Tax=Eremothecium sinecaudum TaxID=45286 RepID=A0A120K2U4_9SACH|nr:HHL148Wp [Eremothecium sinecaudum]AMD22622.1 HHL148Wp [Eremothecium sinecaudum]
MGNRQPQHVVGIHYAVGPKIGEGSFGIIFEGENIMDGSNSTLDENEVGQTGNGTRRPVAIKFEPRRSEAPQLRDEFRAYRILNKCRGIPRAYYFGQEGIHNILIIDLLGPSLEDLFEWCGRKFSVKTTCMLAKQMIDRVRVIHERDLIYRDIKPDNFLIAEYQRELANGEVVKSCAQSANHDPNLIYVVDFGMAKQYRDPKTKQHIPYRERKSLSGTARYMSINTHFGREQSRRDDLESLGHVFFYFLRGSLPWQGLKAPNNKAKYEKIGLTKQKLKPEDLLSEHVPMQFAEYLKYCRALKFEEEPDYDYLISLMDSVMHDLHLEENQEYDWMELNDHTGWNIKINKRANLHGYGNPNPGNYNNNTNNPNHKSHSQRQSDPKQPFQQVLTSSNHQQHAYTKSTSKAQKPHSQSAPHRGSYSAKHRLKFPLSGNEMFSTNPTAKQAMAAQSYDAFGKRMLRTGQQNQSDHDSLAEPGVFGRLCCCSWC